MTSEPDKPKLGLGACLAGNAVRYDGQAKNPSNHVRELCERFETQVFCPEMGVGMGVPRPPIQIVGTHGDLRVLDVETQQNDFTGVISRYAGEVLAQAPDLCGYILVKGSPSCGYDRVKRFNATGNLVARDTQGIFATALEKLDPLLPLEDDYRLNDPGLRASFIARVHAYHEWQQFQQEEPGPGEITAFYSRYKHLVMAHHLPSAKTIGSMLANIQIKNRESVSQGFITSLMGALKHRATRRSHCSVLLHLAGYLNRESGSAEKNFLRQSIEQYRLGEVSLGVPVKILRQHLSANSNAYLNRDALGNLRAS